MKIKHSILISIAITFIILLGVYYLVPIGFLEPTDTTFGSTITTINGSDTLSASRSVINTNFSNLNSGKIEVSTTTLPFITTLSSLSSIGTITTGIWNGTAISVSKGGSGTTTPSRYQVILGDGSLGFTVASSTGVAGQFLTSNGTGAYPSWQTSAVDTSIGYTWTSTHNFLGSVMLKYFNSSSTMVIDGVTYNFTGTQAVASSSVLANDASGNLSWMSLGWDQLGETTLASDASTITVSFPARLDLVAKVYVASSTSEGELRITFNSDSGGNYGYKYFEEYAAGTSGVAQTSIVTAINTTVSSSSYTTFNIENRLGGIKLLDFVGSQQDGISIPQLSTGSGYWNNKTSQITSMTAICYGSCNFKIGSRITVYGKKP